MAKRIYSNHRRRFEITLAEMSASPSGVWQVERVKETSAGGRELAIPGMYNVAASSEDLAFARACHCIDKWLMTTRG